MDNSQRLDSVYDQYVVSELSEKQTKENSCSMLDGPFCFQTLSEPDLPYTEQEALFISEEEYLAVKKVPDELTAATKFLQTADKKELWWNEVK